MNWFVFMVLTEESFIQGRAMSQKIQIMVKTNARRETVERMNDREYRVSVNVPPLEGRANDAVVELLAEYFGVNKSNIQIRSGLRAKKKIVEILE